ncbi:MAG: ATP-binding protein [Bacteroides sp.]
MAEKNLPIGVQSFQNLRENNYLYVDKTKYIAELLNGKVYFLSRPRRFGKSLFLSTLSAYFRGQKELFKGLYIEKVEEELAKQENREAWQEYPVLYLDLNTEYYRNESDLDNILNTHLTAWEALYGKNEAEQTYPSRFKGIIERAYKKEQKQVVVLVDEYDKPLYETLGKEELNTIYRGMLKGVFSVIKSSDQYLRFAFLTGITKFNKVSVFSGLNNLRDLSLIPTFSGICGITETELEENFTMYIDALSTQLAMSREDTLGLLKKEYDGYLFAAKGENVYNPFSLLNVFASQAIAAYWFATGTSSFLVDYLKKAQFYIPDLEGKVRLNTSRFDSYRADMLDPLPILFHAGYLTIKGYDPETRVYRLGFPNNEVRYGFFENLLASYAPSYLGLGFSVNDFLDAVRCGDVDAFMVKLRSLLASIPYDTAPMDDIELRERDYQIAVYLVFALMGLFTQTEVQSTTGRADCIVITPRFVYVFEFKLWSAGSAEEALQQILDKGYATKYEAAGKELILVGTSFDEAKRNIKDWAVQRSEKR